MAGEQNLDRMGGFRRAMPFTFACMVIGGLALSGMPPFSGLLLEGRDPRARWSRATTGTSCSRSLGYVGAFMTAVYTWRMIFRAFYGEPSSPRRASSRTATSHHAPMHTNPATGEDEDTDVGFPGPEHHIAERERSDEGRHGRRSRSCAVIGGVVQIPNVTNWLHNFLEPTFAGSRFYETLEPSDSCHLRRPALGAALGLAGIALAYRLWVVQPERPARIRARFAGLHAFFVHKWYFDELIDTAHRAAVRLVRALRPQRVRARRRQRRARRRHVGRVRAGSAAVRALQSGFLRYYAALLLLGLAALGLYFLIAAS